MSEIEKDLFAMASFDVDPNLLEVDTNHFPHFGVHASGDDPRGFVFAQDPNKNPTFLAFAAIAQATHKKLRIFYRASNPDEPAIRGVSKVEIIME